MENKYKNKEVSDSMDAVGQGVVCTALGDFNRFKPTSLSALPAQLALNKNLISDNYRKRNSKARAAQATVEYVLLLSLIAGMSLGVLKGLQDSLGAGFMRLNAELEKSLVTGSFQQGGVNVHQKIWAR